MPKPCQIPDVAKAVTIPIDDGVDAMAEQMLKKDFIKKFFFGSLARCEKIFVLQSFQIQFSLSKFNENADADSAKI